jgi:hypothetical protein
VTVVEPPKQEMEPAEALAESALGWVIVISVTAVQPLASETVKL